VVGAWGEHGPVALYVCAQLAEESAVELVIDLTPKVESIQVTNGGFLAGALKRLDSRHLFEIAVDPTCEGKGCVSLIRPSSQKVRYSENAISCFPFSSV